MIESWSISSAQRKRQAKSLSLPPSAVLSEFFASQFSEWDSIVLSRRLDSSPAYDQAEGGEGEKIVKRKDS